MTEQLDFRRHVLLSFQRALWDMVTAGLRGVAIRLEYPVIHARFLFESVGEEEAEIASETETYVAADFVPPVVVDFRAVTLPPGEPRVLEAGEEWVFLRRE